MPKITQKKIENSNILITGGLGFIGSNLANHLSKTNKIYVLDNFFTGKIKNKVKGVNYINGDCIDINTIKELNLIKFDYIFHLGEYSRVEQSYKDIDKVISFNILPFYEILKFTKNKKSKLIYSGSSTIYGKYKNNFDISPYTWSKKTNIEFLNRYANWFDIQYAITYFYNVYGNNEISSGKYATVIAKFIRLKKQKIKYLPITAPGNQKRNFTHVNDVVSGLEIVALRGNGDGFGIGSSKTYSIIDLANLLKMKYKITPVKRGNRLVAKLKTKKTKALGWKDKFDLKNYLDGVFK